jgi:hypothetical protein
LGQYAPYNSGNLVWLKNLANQEIFWVGIMFLFTVNIVQFFFLANRSNYSSFVLILHMSSLGILLGLVFIYDHPFIGESGIKPDSFVKALHRMESR